MSTLELTSFESIRSLRNFGILHDMDIYLVEALNRRFCNGGASAESLLAACLANRVVAGQHICLELGALTVPWLAALAADVNFESDHLSQELVGLCHKLEAMSEIELVNSSGGLIGPAASGAPVVLNEGMLYIRRYWNYEKGVAESLKAMLVDSASSKELLGVTTVEELELNEIQLVAAHASLQNRLTIISGGPGTGKTYTAARILYLLSQSKTSSGHSPVIRLAAPTGKAADRLDKSIQEAAKDLDFSLSEPACTIERLLGYKSGSPYYRHDEENKLVADVVLIDEASMVDLPKMAKLLRALKDSCRLILLGDMNQLASVAPGSVLGDICSSEVLKSCVFELTESRRFKEGSPVSLLSKAVLSATADSTGADAAWGLLTTLSAQEDGEAQISVREAPESLTDAAGLVDRALVEDVLEGYGPFMNADTPVDAFAALAGFRILCALRRGPYGVDTVNRLVERVLSNKAVSSTDLPEALRGYKKLQPTGEFYDHRVVMITRNDYSMKLFNGDVGIIMKSAEDPERLDVYFETGEQEGAYRSVPCRLLPEHETAFASTVHKSQGSEFEQVLVLLPGSVSPVLSKELIYTAITRTKNGVKLWCAEDSFKAAVVASCERSTGLLALLDQEL